MASIWKRDRSKYWYACYTAADGRQLKKSTKKTDKDQAMAAALELERAERIAGDGLATEVRYRSLLSEILERVSNGKESLRSVTTRAHLKDWLSTKTANSSDATAERYEHT